MKSLKIMPRKFYERDTVTVAKDLLGKIIVRDDEGSLCSGMIVETEAYECTEAACHAFRGQTLANKALFGSVGHAYIYFIYGMYYCLNVVARKSSVPAGGVLIRALEPLEGIATMQKNRAISAIHELTNGPGKLAQALHITKKLYGIDVTKKGPLFIVEGKTIPDKSIIAAKRIGIQKEQERAWRFYYKESSCVSRV